MRVNLYRIIVAVLALGAPAFAERFELPAEGLESRIEFWKKVYTQYGHNDLIIHDRIHVNLIYDVVSDDDSNVKVRAVASALTEIRDNLDTPENLSPMAKQIRDAILA